MPSYESEAAYTLDRAVQAKRYCCYIVSPTLCTTSSCCSTIQQHLTVHPAATVAILCSCLICSQCRTKPNTALKPCNAGKSGLQLGTIFTYVQQSFVSLITLLPAIIEPYQSVNTDGATVRRYTIINNDHEAAQAADAPTQTPASAAVSQKLSAQKPKPVAQTHTQAAATQVPGLSVTEGTRVAASQTANRKLVNAEPQGISRPGVDAQGQSQAATHTNAATANQTLAAGSDPMLANLPASIQAAIKYMQRRYGSAAVLPTSATISQGTQDTQHALSTGAGSPALCVKLDIQPTDPSWDPKQAEKLHLAIDLSLHYPQKDSLSVKLAGAQAHLSDAACNIANQLIAAESAQHIGRNTAMQQVLRFVENRAGMLLHEAEDICLEAARRRGQNQLSAQSQTQHQSSQHLPEAGAASTSQLQQQVPGQLPMSQAQTGVTTAGSKQHAPPPLTRRKGQASSSDALNGRPHEGRNSEGALATALEATHLSSAREGEADSRSGQDSEVTWDESQWDSSASYSDNVQHDSDTGQSETSASDAEDQPSTSHTGMLLLKTYWVVTGAVSLLELLCFDCQCVLL